MANTLITTVVNIKDMPRQGDYNIVYCGRHYGQPSTFGNPFKIGADGNRSEVVFKHFLYFRKRLISDPAFKAKVLTLKGKKLGCFCHEWNGTGDNPMFCHCDNIADYLNHLG